MINAKEAVAKASKYFDEIYPRIEEKQLEEIEITDDGKYWLITLSFLLRKNQSSVVSPVLEMMRPKKDTNRYKYKIFKISAVTGDVLSMKIRTV